MNEIPARPVVGASVETHAPAPTSVEAPQVTKPLTTTPQTPALLGGDVFDGGKAGGKVETRPDPDAPLVLDDGRTVEFGGDPKLLEVMASLGVTVIQHLTNGDRLPIRGKIREYIA